MPGMTSPWRSIEKGIAEYKAYRADPAAYWERTDREAAPYLWTARVFFILIIGGALVYGVFEALASHR